MSTQIITSESNKENLPENEEKKIPIFSVESILFIRLPLLNKSIYTIYDKFFNCC